MNKVVLAIQTPRAGELHYLWITPKGESISDNELGELLSKLRSQLPKEVNTNAPSFLDSPQLTEALSSGALHNSYYNDNSSDNEDYDSPSDFPVGQQENDSAVNSDTSDSAEGVLPDSVNSGVKDKRAEGIVVKDGMLFSRQVIQTSSGRPGNEELFLYAAGFGESVPEDKRKECSEKLDVFFNDKLEGIIESIDWKKAARDSSVHSSADLKNLADGLSSPLAEFDNLYSEISDLLNPFIKEPEPEPEPMESESGQSNKPKSGKSDTQSDAPKPKTSFSQYVLGLCVIITLLIPIVVMANPGIIEKIKNLIQGNDDQQQIVPMSDKSYEEWKLFFELPQKEEVKAENREELVIKAIEQTYWYYWGNAPKSGDCSLNCTFASKIKKLSQVNPKILTENNNKPEFDCFREATPEGFNKLINDFPKAVNSLKKILKVFSDDLSKSISENDETFKSKSKIDTFIQYLNDSVISNKDCIDRKELKYMPKFFFERDLEILKLLDNLMEEVKVADVQQAFGFARNDYTSDLKNWQDFEKLYKQNFSQKPSN